MARSISQTYILRVITTKITDPLTHWGRVMHICVSDLTSIGSDNGLSPGRRQAIIRTNAGILLIRPLGTNFSEFLVEILKFSFTKMLLKVSFAKRRSFCLGLNELMYPKGTTCAVCVGSPLVAFTKAHRVASSWSLVLFTIQYIFFQFWWIYKFWLNSKLIKSRLRSTVVTFITFLISVDHGLFVKSKSVDGIIGVI